MKNNFIFLLFLFPIILNTIYVGPYLFAYANEDPLEDEIEVEGEADVEEILSSSPSEEENDDKPNVSSEVETALLFIKPLTLPASQIEIPAGNVVEFLVGFHNKGKQDYIVESIDASFRYPMDFNFYIQNFSALNYNKRVEPNQDATFAYSFIPAEAFVGRPFGLNINIDYKDLLGNSYQQAIYNDTVQIIELEEGLDGETFFLYVFMVAGVILLLVIGHQTLLSVGKKKINRRSAPVETGTKNPNNVDYEWLPKQTLANLNKEKSQKSSKQQQQSPKQRKMKSN